MIIVNIKDMRFKSESGIFGYESNRMFALNVAGKGLVSFDGVEPYVPAGGKKACQAIIDGGIDLNSVKFVRAI